MSGSLHAPRETIPSSDTTQGLKVWNTVKTIFSELRALLGPLKFSTYAEMEAGWGKIFARIEQAITMYGPNSSYKAEDINGWERNVTCVSLYGDIQDIMKATQKWCTSQITSESMNDNTAKNIIVGRLQQLQKQLSHNPQFPPIKVEFETIGFNQGEIAVLQELFAKDIIQHTAAGDIIATDIFLYYIQDIPVVMHKWIAEVGTLLGEKNT